VVAEGCDFSPGTLLLAYRSGIFPWPQGHARDVLWVSPNPREIFPLEKPPHWSRSLRRTLRKHPYEVTLDEDFMSVMRMCGETRADDTWIIPELIEGYAHLHALGWAHSVEVWEKTPGGRELVGGIYGVSVGSAFAGESMFHTRTDTSKIAFATLVSALRDAGYTLFDAQIWTSHLASLGCIETTRDVYLAQLADALTHTPKLLLR